MTSGCPNPSGDGGGLKGELIRRSYASSQNRRQTILQVTRSMTSATMRYTRKQITVLPSTV